MSDWNDGGWVSLETILKAMDDMNKAIIDLNVNMMAIHDMLMAERGASYMDSPSVAILLPHNRKGQM